VWYMYAVRERVSGVAAIASKKRGKKTRNAPNFRDGGASSTTNARGRRRGFRGAGSNARAIHVLRSIAPERPSAGARPRRTRRFAPLLGRPTSGINATSDMSPEDARRAAEIERMVAEFSSPSVPEITAEALMAEMRASSGTGNPPYVLVDVRTPDERVVSSIPGSISTVEYESDFDAKYRDERVVAYCTIGYRSGKYVEKLTREKGVDAYNLRGSVLAWTHAGGELVEGGTGEKTTRVHTFGKKWALARSGYDSVWFNAPVVSYVKNLLFGRR